jgi:hypothetical protein
METNQSIQKNVLKTSLIICDNKRVLACANNYVFQQVLSVFESIGGKVDQVNAQLIKRSIIQHKITIEDFEQAVYAFYDSGEFTNWGNIIKYLNIHELPSRYD